MGSFSGYEGKDTNHGWLRDISTVMIPVSLPNDDSLSTWAQTWLTTGNLLSPLIGRVKGMGYYEVGFIR